MTISLDFKEVTDDPRHFHKWDDFVWAAHGQLFQSVATTRWQVERA
jgi:hypothetical protein